MCPAVIDKADLWYREGTSDKVYHATLEKQGSGYVVNFSYGRRGSTLKTGSKTSCPVSLSEARKVYEKLVAEKTAKGYQYTTSINKPIPVVSPTTKPQPEVQCVLLNSIDNVSDYLRNDDWYAQPKLDGVRFLLHKTGNHFVGYNRKGIQTAFPVEILESLRTSDAYYDGGCGDYLLDGELIGDVYYVFDILSKENENLRVKSFIDRIIILRELFGDIESENIKLVDAVTGKDKNKLYEKLQKDNKEGIVFKFRFAQYVPGRPNSGGYYLKNKFYSTISCVVSEINNKRSVGLNVYENNTAVFIGNCTIPVNHPIPSPGDIVEIKYLYAYKNGSLYQPIYLGTRTDLDEKDCEIKQIKFKSESDL